jgi:putative membrane-bound dehydrogenase-like protein
MKLGSRTRPASMFSITSKNFKQSCLFGAVAFGTLAGLAFSTASCSRTRQPATGLSALRVPQGFKVERASNPGLVSYPMMGTLDDRGRLFLCESSGNTLTTKQMSEKPDFVVRMLVDTNHDGIYDQATTFADKLTLPAGAVWYRNALYVAAPPDLVRLEDTNGDGVADKRDVIVTGWHLSSNAASLHGPFFGPDGWLYLTDGRHGYDLKGRDGRAFKGESSRIWRVRPDGTGLEWVAGGGFDNPVELIFLPTGETIGTMTYFQDPANGQRDALMHWVWGGVYPKWYRVVSEFKLTGDLMPVMTKFARIAPAGLLHYAGGQFGTPYRDNLFSAQFNPHRVQRHVLHREGATFRTDDEDFLTSADPDFHPTDVMEDADGSMLVLDTGAWFINGCPISRVAKPEIKGGIYRISKIGAPQVRDARGESLNFSEKKPAELISYMEDPRPAVREHVQELLVNAGGSAVPPLRDAGKQLKSYESRAAAVWALYRIGTPNAEEGVRAALDDPDFRVRIAAARAAGMARDGKSVDRLRQMVAHDEPGARRQAATALGQIGDTRAVPDLIAASKEGDRFVEHSITYALIEMKTPAPLTRALHDSNANVRKTALIALDQMDHSPLKHDQIRPFLQDRDQNLHKVGLWVVSHHPDWSNEVLSYLQARLAAPKFLPDETQSVRDTILSFCNDAGLQNVLAKSLGAANLPSSRQLFLLDTIDSCSLKTFPAPWAVEVGKLLDESKPDVQLRAIGLIRSQQIKGLEDKLQRIANDGNASPELRIAALGSLASSEQMSGAGMQFLVGYLSNTNNDAGMRLSAAQVIGRAKLSREQLMNLAQGTLSKADSLVLPNLLNAYNGQKDKEVGEAMVDAVLKSQTRLGEADAKRLADILQSYPEDVRASARPIMARVEEAQKQRVEHLQKLYPLLSEGGDIGRGRRIFFGDKVSCFSCHEVGKEGGHVGPDLTSIGAIRSGEDILEAIIFPSASFVPGFEPYTVVTHNDTISGVRTDETPDSVTIITGRDSRVRVRRSDIVSMKPSTVSLMPDGLDESLTRSELADLLAFLESQRSNGLMTVNNRPVTGATHE